MGALARRPPLARFPDLVDWLESPWASLLLFAPAPTFPIQNYDEDGRYVVRAGMPDLDPDKDVEGTADAGVLTIHAERREEHEQTHHSESGTARSPDRSRCPPAPTPKRSPPATTRGSARGQRPRPGAGHAGTPPHRCPASPLNDRPAWAVPQRRQS